MLRRIKSRVDLKYYNTGGGTLIEMIRDKPVKSRTQVQWETDTSNILKQNIDVCAQDLMKYLMDNYGCTKEYAYNKVNKIIAKNM